VPTPASVRKVQPKTRKAIGRSSSTEATYRRRRHLLGSTREKSRERGSMGSERRMHKRFRRGFVAARRKRIQRRQIDAVIHLRPVQIMLQCWLGLHT
jgi:hypothetical protein